MIDKIKHSPLFSGLNVDEINNMLKCSNANIKEYQKDSFVFLYGDTPDKLYILIDGKIDICFDEQNGNRKIITTITQSGDLFGEVFVFLQKQKYENYASVTQNSTILEIPKEYLFSPCSKNCDFHKKLISNLMSILAHKAYYLNQKLNILSSNNLRQKICKLFLQNSVSNGEITINTNRENLADFLNVARPSLSRELLKMQDENLILIKNKKIFIKDFDKMKSFL